MNVRGNKSGAQKRRFHEYDCVVLKRDISGTPLKKGDVGAIMDVLAGEEGNFYDVDFTEKRELEHVPENVLKIDFRLQQKKGKPLYAEDASQPPPMPQTKGDNPG